MPGFNDRIVRAPKCMNKTCLWLLQHDDYAEWYGLDRIDGMGSVSSAIKAISSSPWRERHNCDSSRRSDRKGWHASAVSSASMKSYERITYGGVCRLVSIFPQSAASQIRSPLLTSIGLLIGLARHCVASSAQQN